jgi:hypothetical protein
VKIAAIAGYARQICAGVFLAIVLIAAPAQGRESTAAPALWKIDGDKGDIYFFGSIHILPPDLAWQTPELEQALKAARKIHFEIDIDEAQNPQVMGDLVTRFGFLPQGSSLRRMLAPEYRSKLDTVARSLGLSAEAMDRMRPWLAAITLTTLQATQQMTGKAAPPAPGETGGADSRLWNWAKANGKERGTLETAESQIRLFADLSREQELQFLVVTLQQAASANRLVSQLLNAWKDGKARQLDELLNRDMDKFPALRKALFDDRHVNWMPQIEAMMSEGDDHLVVVGAAHLVGRGSIIDMLRAKGIKVEGP